MAKGETRNPAEAHRKALKKKELKKNKAERAKARELSTVKTDTSAFEVEIQKLENKSGLSAKESQRLNDLQAEVSRIRKKKEEYVAQHPEHRRLVYRSIPKTEEQENPKSSSRKNFFDKNGRPRHPERSIYYDPVFNPYGAPPPGMPYLERPPFPGEKYSDHEDSEDDDDDDDIELPDTPHPVTEPVVDSDDDIELPEGPPPGGETDRLSSNQPPLPPPIPSIPAHSASAGFRFPPTFHPPHISQGPVAYALSPSTTVSTKSGQPFSHSSASSSAVISAEPVLRDFRKESTAFIPAALKRKRAGGPKNS